MSGDGVGGADPIYLDHNATTPVDPKVLAAMLPYFTDVFGNPSSVEHLHGNRAQTAVTKARAQVAAALGARDNEIVFTGSCTEANNIAILGAARARAERRHLVTTAIEHPAVLESFRQLAREGFELTILGVDEFGRVSADAVAAALRDDTGLVSVMGANNEVGTIQPIAAIGAVCAARDVLFHTDLAQVMAHRRVDVAAENIHLASISGHKAYGPKGIGALYVRSRSPRARLTQTVYGGGQEKGLRSGTLNVPLIVGMGVALELAAKLGATEAARLRALCAAFVDRIAAAIPDAQFNGHPTERIPGNVSLSIPGIEPLALMHKLNGIASFSASSACATDKVETSHVLLAIFGDTPRARQAFRVSPGRFTTVDDITLFADSLIAEVAALRRFAA
ncbi:cysteine desulfurase [Sphingobium sp. B11D3B]|uniref:cysteine desulfurase family protein n=1 Tax=Sphingobium sp. B11D3B TaxID=2940575 RepID=UPI002226956C|nr:cysteine desulfurase family protein [Sphingobium sp. B11D3B]MCW2390071.1 cysteine desulfurase [Sphingobium sp. B11D3B]